MCQYPCITPKVILYRSLPVLYMLIAMIDTFLWFLRANSLQKEPNTTFNDRQMYVGFLLDCIGSIIGILTGILFYIFIIVTTLSCICAACAGKDAGEYIFEKFCQSAALRFMTLNCNCPCYIRRPKRRFFHRTLLLMISGLLRFAAVIVYATAKPNDTYAKRDQAVVLCGLSILCPICMILLDTYRYRIWWHYRPSGDDATSCQRLSKKHVRFLPYHLLDNNHSMVVPGNQPCVNKEICTNRRLEHIMIFHSSQYKPQLRWRELSQSDRERGIYVGFHRTKAEYAVKIAHSDFRISETPPQMLGHGVYFARSVSGTEGKARQNGAIICAEVQMGRVKEVTRDDVRTVSNNKRWWADFDTVYLVHPDDGRDEFCVKDPSQILRWVMIVDKEYDENVNRFRLDREFENTRCGCV